MTTPISQTIPFHNPANLTPEQVGDGWRLLTKEETEGEPNLPGLEMWLISGWKSTRGGFYYATKSQTFRAREPLPEKYWRRFVHKNGFGSNIKHVEWDGISCWSVPFESGREKFPFKDLILVGALLNEGIWKELPAQAPDDDKEPDFFSAEYQKSLRLKWAENPGIEREHWIETEWKPTGHNSWVDGCIYRERIRPEVKMSFGVGNLIIDGKFLKFTRDDGKPLAVYGLTIEKLWEVAKFVEKNS